MERKPQILYTVLYLQDDILPSYQPNINYTHCWAGWRSMGS